MLGGVQQLCRSTDQQNGENERAELTGLAVYRRNLTRLCRGPEDLKAEIQRAIFTELADQLGLDEAARTALGVEPAPAQLSAELLSMC